MVKALTDVTPSTRRIDICICTHQDSDHANGFHGFADAWCSTGRSIGEFWLPGRWATAVRDIITDPHGAIERVLEGVVTVLSRIQKNGAGCGDLLSLGARLRELGQHKETEEDVPRAADSSDIGRDETPDQRSGRVAECLGLRPDNLEHLRAQMEETDTDRADSLCSRSPFPCESLLYFGPRCGAHNMLYCAAMETARTIRRIAEASIRWNIPVRWFDFDLFERQRLAIGGIRGLLEPVSAVEIRRPPRQVAPSDLLLCLYLSRENVESLVFLRPETEDESAALFLGDSRLSFGVASPTHDFPMPTNKPARRLLATAPHHGSQVNDHAYDVIAKWLSHSDRDSPIYIRNGGQSGQSLGRYRTFARRACAQCVQCTDSSCPQAVIIETHGSDWGWPPRFGVTCP